MPAPWPDRAGLRTFGLRIGRDLSEHPHGRGQGHVHRLQKAHQGARRLAGTLSSAPKVDSAPLRLRNSRSSTCARPFASCSPCSARRRHSAACSASSSSVRRSGSVMASPEPPPRPRSGGRWHRNRSRRARRPDLHGARKDDLAALDEPAPLAQGSAQRSIVCRPRRLLAHGPSLQDCHRRRLVQALRFQTHQQRAQPRERCVTHWQHRGRVTVHDPILPGLTTAPGTIRRLASNRSPGS